MRLRLASAAVLALMLCGLTSVGCGKKAPPASVEVAETAPPPVPPRTTTQVAPVVTPVPVIPPTLPPVIGLTPAPVVAVPPKVDPVPMVVQPPVTTPAPPPTIQVPPVTPIGQPTIPPQPTPAPVVAVPPKSKDFEWPKDVNGRDVMAFLKDCTDPDPALREVGLRTLPAFGPSTRKIVDKEGRNLFAKTVLTRMNNDKEKDPGVRTAAFATAATMGFEDDGDTKEAVRILGYTADEGVAGGLSRQHAIQALGAFGPKGEPAVPTLVGRVVADPAYETRRSLAFTLGRIGFNDSTGPNAKALLCLTSQLASDHSAVVRLEALQSLSILGPPWEGVRPAGDKNPPKLDMKGVAAHVGALKKRLAPAPVKGGEKSSSGLVERDKQVELWVRFVLMRFDTKEINDDNIVPIARAVAHPDQGPRIQALAILSMMSEYGAKRLDDITRPLHGDDLVVVQAAINALIGLGHLSKPALPELRKLLTHKDEATKKLAADAVKFITEAKSPAEMMKKP